MNWNHPNHFYFLTKKTCQIRCFIRCFIYRKFTKLSFIDSGLLFSILNVLFSNLVRWEVATEPSTAGQFFDCCRRWRQWNIYCCYSFTFYVLVCFKNAILGPVFWQCPAKVWLSNGVAPADLSRRREMAANSMSEWGTRNETRLSWRLGFIRCYASVAASLACDAYFLAYFPCIMTARVWLTDWPPAAVAYWTTVSRWRSSLTWPPRHEALLTRADDAGGRSRQSVARHCIGFVNSSALRRYYVTGLTTATAPLALPAANTSFNDANQLAVTTSSDTISASNNRGARWVGGVICAA